MNSQDRPLPPGSYHLEGGTSWWSVSTPETAAERLFVTLCHRRVRHQMSGVNRACDSVLHHRPSGTACDRSNSRLSRTVIITNELKAANKHAASRILGNMPVLPRNPETSEFCRKKAQKGQWSTEMARTCAHSSLLLLDYLCLPGAIGWHRTSSRSTVV